MTERSFIENLTEQLVQYQDKTFWLSVDTVQEMLIRAANEAVDKPADMKLWREVEPMDLDVFVRFELEGESWTMWPEDVATLRALLLSFDESGPARIGEPLSIPAKLESGRVVSTVTQELLDKS